MTDGNPIEHLRKMVRRLTSIWQSINGADNDSIESFRKMVYSLIQEEWKPDELQHCPECGGELHVRFEVYKSGDRRKLGVQVRCENCQVNLAMDGVEPIPKWAREP